jgi:predicted metal-dependent HD superfamily phosphohydrolase
MPVADLKDTFLNLLTKYNEQSTFANQLWEEIEKSYSGSKRYYHTLTHLDHLLEQLTEVKHTIKNWDATLFSLYYHDIVYNTLKSDNEEKSAALAEKRMGQVRIPTELIENCKVQILATKSHLKEIDEDTNYFTDADLSILGQSPEVYTQYYKNIRKEYSIYPDIIYNPGRKEVLKIFLEMGRIFKTNFFHAKFEKQAKKNLQAELDLLE